MVMERDWADSFRLASIRLWCAQVIVTPDASSTAVLSSGTSMGLSGKMPVGGQCPPV